MRSPQPHQPGRCRDLLAELFDYLDEELTPARCRALERHLDDCPCCGELAANLRKAIAVCRAEGQHRLPAAVRTRARQRVTDLLGHAAKRA
jgi:anti-sigma factor RsiW